MNLADIILNNSVLPVSLEQCNEALQIAGLDIGMVGGMRYAFK